MLTCSNCGAAARPGAKFCTSCGARLPIVQTSEGSGWGSKDDQTRQSSPWSSAPANGQQTPSTSEPATVSAPAANDQPPATTGGPSSGNEESPWGQTSGAAQGGDSDASSAPTSGSTTSSPSWTWGQSHADDTTQSDTASAAPPAAGESDTTAFSAQPNWISSWTGPSSDAGEGAQAAASEAAQPAASDDTSGWSFSDAAKSGAPAETDYEATGDEQQGAENANPDARPEWMRNLTAASEETMATTPDQGGGDSFSATTETIDERAPEASQEAVSADTGAGASGARDWSGGEQTTATTAEADAGSAGIAEVASTAASSTGPVGAAADGTGQSESAASAPAATSATMAPDRSSSDALSEAQGLLDRLRDLLPALAVPAAAGANTSGIADQLQQAYDQNAKPEFDDLRSVLEAAEERPRDVDTMLNLVAKIDPMLTLLQAHGNLLTAIRNAVTQLRDQNSGQ